MLACLRPAGCVGLFCISLNAWPALAQTLQNPGFEATDGNGNPSGWTEAAGFVTNDPSNNARTYAPPTYALSQALEGQRVYGVVKDGSRLGGVLYQRVPGTTVGKRYRAGIWCRTFRTGNGEMRCTIGIDPAGGTDHQLPRIVWSVPVSSDGLWSPIEIDATATASAITVYLTLGQSGNTGFAINYVDRAELIADPPMTITCTDSSRIVTTSDRRVDVAEQIEANYTVPAGYVITGIGARGSGENVSTMVVRQNRLLPDGNLQQGELVYFGYEPNGGTEAAVMLPPCYLAVGFGARAAPEFDIYTLAVWARPLTGDGRLGPVEEFRAGIEPNGGLERQFLAEEGRVLTGVGLRMQFSDITGIRGVTDRYNTTPVHPQPSIQLDPGEIDRTTRQGRNPQSDTFTVTNVGTAPLNYTISSPAGWLSITPIAGSSGGETDTIQIDYDVSGLPVGVHSTKITVADPTADNSPQTVIVNLTLTPIPGDFDHDGDIDHSDFGHLQSCLTGAGVAQTDPRCRNARLDNDEDVDQDDFGIFQSCISGANVPADPECAP